MISQMENDRAIKPLFGDQATHVHIYTADFVFFTDFLENPLTEFLTLNTVYVQTL